MNLITTEWDDYLQERMELKSRWEVTLSNGVRVFQDDERQGRPSWIGLKEYLSLNPELHIVRMFMGFRDHIIVLPENCDGYFFRYALISCWGAWEKHSFIIGTLNDGVLSVDKYELPEVVFMGTEIRSIDDAGESLIVKSGIEK